jgi:hemerythrin-like domain-containing protein
MSDKQHPPTNEAAPFQDTLDEHRECMQYVVAIESCLDRRPDDASLWIGRLMEHLPGLARTMREHFEAEEQGKLFNDLPKRSPMVYSRIETLKEEHPRLLREVERIIEVASEMRDAELHELREINARIQLFVARLRRHEATENELIFEAYWDDYGTGD